MDIEHIPGDVEGLNKMQTTMIEGALAINDYKTADIMTDFSKVFVLPFDSILDEKLVIRIKEIGFSRIPLC
jgi:CBS domain containing-hemolysin-like protein